jgi:hypothetical protein
MEVTRRESLRDKTKSASNREPRMVMSSRAGNKKRRDEREY